MPKKVILVIYNDYRKVEYYAKTFTATCICGGRILKATNSSTDVIFFLNGPDIIRRIRGIYADQVVLPSEASDELVVEADRIMKAKRGRLI